MRATRACSGYRDTEQLRIRDESQTTKQKALIRSSRGVPPILTISMDDRARNAFFSHYVTGFTTTYDIIGLLYRQGSLEHHLAASVDAVSLAYFSFQYYCTKASQIASKKYSDALPLLNKALKVPESATSNSTLLAVLLLDLFEKMTEGNPRSTDSWMSHVSGALTLIKLRGSKQFSDYVGLRLSVRLSTNLLISCVAANAPVPPALIKLRADIEPFLDRDDPKWRVSGLVVRYADLRRDVQGSYLSTSDIVGRATELDREFMALASSMPSTWLYDTIKLDQTSEGVFEQHFDTYLDHHITQTWNVLRTMRIFLNDIVRTCYIQTATGSYGEVSIGRNWDRTTNIIDGLAKDICASAPQYTRPPLAFLRNKNHSATRNLRCYTLLFPLYVAGMYASPTTEIKPWIIEQLRFLSNEMGIRNASVVAGILERADGTSPWSLYAILGSYAFAA